MKARQYINMMGMAAAVLLSSCVKDTLYDTPHPDYGKIAVTADWSARGEGIDIPTTWTVTMGDYTGTETSATHAPNHLFAPGSYTIAVWNPAEGIMVKGSTTFAREPQEAVAPSSVAAAAVRWQTIQAMLPAASPDGLTTSRNSYTCYSLEAGGA